MSIFKRAQGMEFKYHTKLEVQIRRIFLPVLLFFLPCTTLHAQFFGAGYQTVIKSEYQYSDYLSYGYPDPILYEYPDVPYSQPLPYFSAFPEHRFLTKITQYFGFQTSLGLRYQWGYLDKANRQNIYNAELIRELNDQFSVSGAYQYMQANNSQTGADSISGHMFEIGGKFNFAGAVYIEPTYGYYTSGYVYPNAERGGAHSATLKLRQALSSTTAIQVKYNYFYVDYTAPQESRKQYHANTVTVWLSQFLPTETAVHLSGRFYRNTAQTQSFSPSLEIIQYLNWKTILHLCYRYYRNTPREELFLQRITGDYFVTNAVSAILDYSLSANTSILLKYRFYTSNQDIRMSTYLFGFEQIL